MLIHRFPICSTGYSLLLFKKEGNVMKKTILCFLVLLTFVGCTTKPKVAPEDILDFTLDGHYYILPTNVKEFTDDGWKFCDAIESEEDINLGKHQYVAVYYCKNDALILLIIANSTSQNVSIDDAKVVGFALEPLLLASFVSLSDQFLTVKGIDLSSTVEELEDTWKKYPSFEKDNSIYSYIINSNSQYPNGAGIRIVYYIRDIPDSIYILSDDITLYDSYISPEALLKQTNNEKEFAFNINQNYDHASSITYFVVGFFEGTVVDKKPVYHNTVSNSSTYDTYIIEDEKGQQIAIFTAFDIDISLEIGQKCEVWGVIDNYTFLFDDTPILTIDLFFMNVEGIEVFNYILR